MPINIGKIDFCYSMFIYKCSDKVILCCMILFVMDKLIDLVVSFKNTKKKNQSASNDILWNVKNML